MKEVDWKRYAFEFLSIFIAVISAFALGNWNDNRRNRHAEIKILNEIRNGLQKDIADIKVNVGGHRAGIRACNYWRDWLAGKTVFQDSVPQYYLNLTRDFICIQNISGYESLKSKGLEIIENDSLRLKIISLYEYDFTTLRKLEEDYSEMQFQRNYFHKLNEIISPYFTFDSVGQIIHIAPPGEIDQKNRNLFLTYLWKIHTNRGFIMR